MLNNQNVIEGAIENLENSITKGFELNNAELSALSNWSYLVVFLFEAEESLALSESINKKEKFTGMDEIILSHGMFRNGLLSYAKCFSSSGTKKISLDPKTLFNGNEDLRAVHDKIMSIRNTFIAHNGENGIDVSLVPTWENDKEITMAFTYTIR